MIPPVHTSLYAAALAVLFIVLSAQVIKARRSAQIAIGAGDDPTLQRTMRVHANFGEYVPITLILLGFAEMNGTWPWLIHAIGLLFLASRCLHAWGVSQSPENLTLRVRGMTGTFFGMGFAATAAMGSALLYLVMG